MEVGWGAVTSTARQDIAGAGSVDIKRFPGVHSSRLKRLVNFPSVMECEAKVHSAVTAGHGCNANPHLSIPLRTPTHGCTTEIRLPQEV